MSKEERLFEGIKYQWGETDKLFKKHEGLMKRYQILREALTHYGGVLKDPYKMPIAKADEWIIQNAKYLKDEDKDLLRQLREEIINVDEVAIKTVFRGKGTKKIKLTKEEIIAKGEEAKEELGMGEKEDEQ